MRACGRVHEPCDMSERPADQALVSIVLPTYKRAHVLPSAIRSVLNQTYTNLELIVVDDNSPDDTRDVVASFGDPRIRYVRNEPNLKLPRALNRGFSLARGEYLTWTSDDNLYGETRSGRWSRFCRTRNAISSMRTTIASPTSTRQANRWRSDHHRLPADAAAGERQSYRRLLHVHARGL